MEHEHTHEASGDLRAAFFLNLVFTLLELVGGFLTNSVAIMSDALHDLGDSISLGLSWYLDRYAQRGEDERYSYGYRRYSLLGALANTIILIVGGILVLSEAVPRLMDPETPNATGMALFAVGGIVANGLAVLRVRGGKSLSAQVVSWHLMEDVLGWVAVLVVSVVLLFADLPILDPVLSVLITLYVLYNVVGKLRTTLSLFLQAVPREMDVEGVESQLLALEGVCGVHHTHIWSLDGVHHVLSTHLIVEENTSKDQAVCIKEQARALVDRATFEHTTIEVEYSATECPLSAPHGSDEHDHD
jgi:cobalt-zinc-cadmium efflux system protein